LSFEGIRITASIRIVTDTQFHLVACVEISKVSRIADTEKNYRRRTMETSKKGNGQLEPPHVGCYWKNELAGMGVSTN